MIKTISILLILVMTSFPQREEKKATTNTNLIELSVENLSKKWHLNKYKIFFRSYPIEENERGDYIHFNNDMTFSSVSEGILDMGIWSLDKKSKRVTMSSHKEEGELILIVKKITSNILTLVIDDPNDSDAKYLSIIFKTQK